MLVVVAIIAILVALTSAAIFRTIGSQDVKNTDITLNKLHSELDGQIKQVIDQGKEEFRAGKYPPGLISEAGNNQDAAQALWIQLRLQQEFPTSFKEATSPTVSPGGQVTLPVKPTYMRVVSSVTSQGAYHESAVCLVMALSQARRNDPPKLEQALGASSLTTVGNGKVVIDSWNDPIWYVRDASGKKPDVVSAGPDATAGTGDDRHSTGLR